MARTYNDSQLWARFIGTLRQAGCPSAALETTARILVAAVRVQRNADRKTIAPGEAIPAALTAVYDLDGDIWDRTPPGWLMRGFNAEEHETQAGKPATDADLLGEYGPVTQLAPAP